MIKKILIVDDSPISRKIMKSCIPKDRGYELCEASDGFAGVEAYKSFQPDVTFMDLTMPVMDGTCATEEIRKFDAQEPSGPGRRGINAGACRTSDGQDRG